MRPYLDQYENLVILVPFRRRSASRAFAGYLLANASVIREFLAVRQPYSVDSVFRLLLRRCTETVRGFVPGINQIIEQRGVLLEGLKTARSYRVRDS